MKENSRRFLGIFWVLALILILVNPALSRTIRFSGYDWNVRLKGKGLPGPNYWSESPENVLVDGNGWLHLKITYNIEKKRWECSEVYSRDRTQYGKHLFYIISRLDSLDQNVVASVFAYKDTLNEIDIEWTRWGQPNPGYNAQYVVQPWSRTGNLERFLTVLSGTYTAHYFDWQADHILFKSIHGHHEEPSHQWELIYEWLYEGKDIPKDKDSLRVHINLYLDRGNPPSDGKEVEIIIKSADLPLIKQ